MATELRNAMAGSTSGEIFGAARGVLRKIRGTTFYEDPQVKAVVDEGIEAINRALGGWWRA